MTDGDFTIRPARTGDAADLLALNAANVPEVGTMDDAKLSAFLERAPLFLVVELAAAGGAVDESEVVGMLICLTERSTFYQSPNYRWFAERHECFAYVDRIALAPAARGTGCGPALYRRAVAVTEAAGRPVLCAEVNTEPDNPRSHRFHQRFGFVEVGRARPYGPDEEVAMYEFTPRARP